MSRLDRVLRALLWVALGLALALALSSCILRGDPPPPNEADHPILATVTYPAGAPEVVRYRLRVAILAHVFAFERKELRGARIPTTRVVVPWEPVIRDCGLAPSAIGCWRGGDLVEVVRGESDEVPALYHELYHRVFGTLHLASNAALWDEINARGRVVSEELRSSR